jgi:hypothetical protein
MNRRHFLKSAALAVAATATTGFAAIESAPSWNGKYMMTRLGSQVTITDIEDIARRCNVIAMLSQLSAILKPELERRGVAYLYSVTIMKDWHPTPKYHPIIVRTLTRCRISRKFMPEVRGRTQYVVMLDEANFRLAPQSI